MYNYTFENLSSIWILQLDYADKLIALEYVLHVVYHANNI